jgi:hypothetical protein
MADQHPYSFIRVRPFTFTQESLAEWPVAPRYARWRTVFCTACGRHVLLWREARIIFPPVCRRAAGGAGRARPAGGLRPDGLAA